MENISDNIKIDGREALRRFLAERSLNDRLIDTFDGITKLYMRVNSVINISALRTSDDIYTKHYLDSIYPFEYFGGECCDVGCGGGFPAIPLAVVTGLDFTGIDGVGKKLKLIELARTELGIKNVKGEHVRAEELARTGKQFDTVCARAVADTEKALGYCAKLCRTNGKIVLYKTQNDLPASEQACKKIRAQLYKTVDYTLPYTEIRRRLFIYVKL